MIEAQCKVREADEHHAAGVETHLKGRLKEHLNRGMMLWQVCTVARNDHAESQRAWGFRMLDNVDR